MKRSKRKGCGYNMENKRFVSEIFNRKPLQWGLRGDPYLWDDLQKIFNTVEVPHKEETFLQELLSYIQLLIGGTLNQDSIIIVEHYNKGGMSGGSISGDFWFGKAIPLLIKRLQEINDEVKDTF